MRVFCALYGTQTRLLSGDMPTKARTSLPAAADDDSQPRSFSVQDLVREDGWRALVLVFLLSVRALLRERATLCFQARRAH